MSAEPRATAELAGAAVQACLDLAATMEYGDALGVCLKGAALAVERRYGRRQASRPLYWIPPDVGLSATKPSNTPNAVESAI